MYSRYIPNESGIHERRIVNEAAVRPQPPETGYLGQETPLRPVQGPPSRETPQRPAQEPPGRDTAQRPIQNPPGRETAQRPIQDPPGRETPHLRQPDLSGRETSRHPAQNFPGRERPRPYDPSQPPAFPFTERMHRGPPGRPPPPAYPEAGSSLLQALSGLFRGIDWEDLLILAILVLVLKEDGAERTVIGIAAALYLLLR